jgi:hypothetical protein
MESKSVERLTWIDITGKVVVSEVGKPMRWRSRFPSMSRTYRPTALKWLPQSQHYDVQCGSVHIAVLSSQVREVVWPAVKEKSAETCGG